MENQKNNFNPWDYVRAVNVRGEPKYQANPDEKVIIAHRGNLILGDKHSMKVQSIKERARVITEYQKNLKADLAVKGQMYHTLKNIAKDIV